MPTLLKKIAVVNRRYQIVIKSLSRRLPIIVKPTRRAVTKSL